jgi:hypothetical protein
MRRISIQNTKIQNVSLGHWKKYFQNYLTKNRTEYKNNKPQEKLKYLRNIFEHFDNKNATKKL